MITFVAGLSPSGSANELPRCLGGLHDLFRRPPQSAPAPSFTAPSGCGTMIGLHMRAQMIMDDLK